MSALRGTVSHVSGYDPRCIEVDLVDLKHDLEPDDEVAVHAVKHAADETGETFGHVLGEMLGDAYGTKVLEQLGELEVIVRDLAASDVIDRAQWLVDSTVGERIEAGVDAEDVITDLLVILSPARAWVSAHPVSGDPQ